MSTATATLRVVCMQSVPMCHAPSILRMIAERYKNAEIGRHKKQDIAEIAYEREKCVDVIFDGWFFTSKIPNIRKWIHQLLSGKLKFEVDEKEEIIFSIPEE